MTATAAWAGVIVADLGASVRWYAAELGAALADRDRAWAKLTFPNATCIELFEGDRGRPGATFPSYGSDPGPPVMPGYAVDEPEGLALSERLRVARALPGWVVVAAPDRLRVALIAADVEPGRGLVGFRFTTTMAADQQAFLDRLAITGPEVADGEVAVVPVLSGRRSADLTDPDGTAIAVVARPPRPGLR